MSINKDGYGTHYEGCYKDHIPCALARIAALEAQLKHEEQGAEAAVERIAALEASIKAGREEWLLCCKALEEFQSEAGELSIQKMQAEAEVEFWKAQTNSELRRKWQLAASEIARLRVCGNCKNLAKHRDDCGCWCLIFESPTQVHPHDS